MTTTTSASEQATVCLVNIGPRERRKRMTYGVGLFAVGAVATAVLVALGTDRLWRLALFLPFWAGALSVFQARHRT